jgi:crotonobetainyl-CoA hydratase
VSYQFCHYERREHISIVTINRPEVLNALHGPAHEEMAKVWDAFEADEEAWVAIFTGIGDRAFSAGSDIKAIAEGTYTSPEEGWGGICKRTPTKPVIAAVNGYAVGGGLEAVLACDIVVSAEHAQFGLPELRSVGLLPGDGGIFRLARRIPLNIAMEMVLTGKFISAQEAYRLGLVNHLVPKEKLMDKAIEVANSICENPPIAVRIAKEFILRSLDTPAHKPTTAWDLYDVFDPKILESEDAKSGEGARAFVEKRKPVWKGR